MRVAGLTFGIVALFAIRAHPQPVVSARAGLIDLTERDVSLDGDLIRATADRFVSVNNGQVLRTGPVGSRCCWRPRFSCDSAPMLRCECAIAV